MLYLLLSLSTINARGIRGFLPSWIPLQEWTIVFFFCGVGCKIYYSMLIESVFCVVAALLEAGYAWEIWLFFYFLG